MSSMIGPIDKNYRKKLLVKAGSEDAALAELLRSKFKLSSCRGITSLPSFLLTLIMIMMMKMRMLSGQVLRLTQKEQVG